MKVTDYKQSSVDYSRSIQLFTGGPFWPITPNGADVSIEDIAHALSLKCRFSGMTSGLYSVAQHSVLVAQEAKENKLLALLHDATEAYLPDLAGPIKDLFYVKPSGTWKEPIAFKYIEDALMCAILIKLVGLDLCHSFFKSEVHQEIKRADKVLLATEQRDLMPQRDWTKKYEFDPMDQKIVPWSPEKAEEMFLWTFEHLKELECSR